MLDSVSQYLYILWCLMILISSTVTDGPSGSLRSVLEVCVHKHLSQDHSHSLPCGFQFKRFFGERAAGIFEVVNIQS